MVLVGGFIGYERLEFNLQRHEGIAVLIFFLCGGGRSSQMVVATTIFG